MGDIPVVAFLSNGIDQQEADDKHHRAGDSMNGKRSRLRSARPQINGHDKRNSVMQIVLSLEPVTKPSQTWSGHLSDKAVLRQLDFELMG